MDTAFNRAVEGIGHILGKPLGEDDSVIVNGAGELSSGVFDRLRAREWLNCWDIAAALEMTDRPVFVQLGLSVPLHTKGANGKATPNSNPFGRWRKKIDDYMRSDMNDLGRPQVFICPLNINADHFTLLEINEQTKMIYHYDSMASYGIINHKTKSTLVRRVVEVRGFDRPVDVANLPQAEFKDLGFGYTEAVSSLLKTPPRTDPASSLLPSRKTGGVAV